MRTITLKMTLFATVTLTDKDSDLTIPHVEERMTSVVDGLRMRLAVDEGTPTAFYPELHITSAVVTDDDVTEVRPA